MVSLGAVRAP